MKKVIFAALCTIVLFSCTKEGANTPKENTETYMIQLQVIDQNGHIEYSPITFLK